jgi:hypothetical protein
VPQDEGHGEVKGRGLNVMGSTPNIVGSPANERSSDEHSFDQLAKGIANGAVTRRRALKVAGASLLGSTFLELIPGVANARKRKKKKCPKPPTCGAGISPGCFQCGTPTKAGEVCVCLPGADGTPQCINALQGSFNSCITNADCSGGAICVDFTSCGMGHSKECALPCS